MLVLGFQAVSAHIDDLADSIIENRALGERNDKKVTCNYCPSLPIISILLNHVSISITSSFSLKLVAGRGYLYNNYWGLSSDYFIPLIFWIQLSRNMILNTNHRSYYSLFRLLFILL